METTNDHVAQGSLAMTMVDLPARRRTVAECIIHVCSRRTGMRLVDHLVVETEGAVRVWIVWELTQVRAAKEIDRANGDRFVTLDMFQPRPRALLDSGHSRVWRTNEAVYQGARWSEREGPPHHDCPLAFIDLAGKLPATWPKAIKWRKAVWAHHTKASR
jgi:hypothetical protein